jgi:hypothetical protein
VFDLILFLVSLYGCLILVFHCLGAYDVFNDDDDTEAHKFMDTDIDQLLEQSSRKVTYGDAATNSLSSGLGSFSKASFVASTGEGDGKDVDLDDPDVRPFFYHHSLHISCPHRDYYFATFTNTVLVQGSWA